MTENIVKKQDEEGHWYWIPESLVSQFENDLSKIIGKWYIDCVIDFDNFNIRYEKNRTMGSPNNIPEHFEGDKYYTPDITEFRDGFEYQYKSDKFMGVLDSTKGEWVFVEYYNVCSMDGDSEYYDVCSLIDSGNIRVKKLDVGDIKDLGWFETNNKSEFVKNNYKLNFISNSKHNLKITNIFEDVVVFFGLCKNKKDFEVLENQVIL